MAGGIPHLPFGKLVLENIIQIILKKMNGVGGNEISLYRAKQPKDVQSSGRWMTRLWMWV